jgi:hypothetical protein
MAVIKQRQVEVNILCLEVLLDIMMDLSETQPEVNQLLKHI